MSVKNLPNIVPLLLSGFFLASMSANATPPQTIDYRNPVHPPSIRLRVLGTYRVGFFNTKGAEIVAHDPGTQRLFVINVADFSDATGQPLQQPRVDVLSIKNPRRPKLKYFIDLSEVFGQVTTVPTSVAVHNGIVAVAVHQKPENGTVPDRDQPAGKILFYEARGNENDKPLSTVDIDGIPDMVTFTPNGRWALTANVASLSTRGSVSVIRVKRRGREVSLRLAGFSGFDLPADFPGVRYIPGFPGIPESLPTEEDTLSPEYVAVFNNSRTAAVTLEPNNAMAIVDIRAARVTDILPLGRKDHRLDDNGFTAFDGQPGSNALDPSDEDEDDPSNQGKPYPFINIDNWPVFGMYQPDAIAAYRARGRTYLVTANEGNTFDDDLERVRAKDLLMPSPEHPIPLCEDAEARAFLSDAQLGRLRVTQLPLVDYGFVPPGDSSFPFPFGCFNDLYAFGARSFSIWSSEGRLVFDSGDDFERITAEAVPEFFNSDDNENIPDIKSDDMGPEPEGVTVGKIAGRYYAFVVLERISGVMVYDVTNPRRPRFQQYINNRDFSVDIEKECTEGEPETKQCAKVGDLGPEGVLFIDAPASPIKDPLLVVANETSGSTTIYQIRRLRRR
jgi:hypothetical protein